MAGTSAALEELSREAKNWSLASDAKLLLWMKAFGERVERRTRAIHLELSELSCQVSHMDVSVKNASNHLASLGSSQFVENRVSEDVGVRTHGDGVRGQVAEAQASKQVSPESLEAAITARYRQAAQSGWQAVQQALDYVPSGTFVAPEQAALGHTGGAVNMEEALRPLPHVIGTEAFAYDNSCGLAADAAAPRDYSVMLPYGKQGSWLLPGVAGQEATRAQEAAASSSGWSSSAEDDKGPEHLVPNPKEDTWSSAEEEEEEDLESDSESALRGGELGGGEEGKARVRRAKVPPGGGGAGGHTGQRTSETEPAVFAADNFRAMLEAALRGPSEYDGGMVHEPSYLPEVSVEGGGVSLVNDDYITDSMPPGSHAPVSSREEDAQSAPAGGDGVTGGIRSHDDLPAVPSLISPVVQGGTPQVVPGGGTSESQLHGIKDLAAVGDGTGGKLGFASTLEEVLRRGQREGLQPKRIISTNQRTPLGSHLGHEETGGANVEHRGKDSEAVPARIDDRTIPEKSGDGATGNGRVSSTQAHVALPFLPEEEEEEGSEEEDEDDSDIFGSLAVNKARGARPSYALSYEDLLGSGARASLSLGRGARPPPPPLPPAPPLMSRLRPQGMGARGPSGDGKEDDEGDASVYVGRPEPSHSQKRREETLLRGLVSDAASSNSHGGGDNDDNGNASALRSFLAAPQQKAAAGGMPSHVHVQRQDDTHPAHATSSALAASSTRVAGVPSAGDSDDDDGGGAEEAERRGRAPSAVSLPPPLAHGQEGVRMSSGSGRHEGVMGGAEQRGALGEEPSSSWGGAAARGLLLPSPLPGAAPVEALPSKFLGGGLFGNVSCLGASARRPRRGLFDDDDVDDNDDGQQEVVVVERIGGQGHDRHVPEVRGKEREATSRGVSVAGGGADWWQAATPSTAPSSAGLHGQIPTQTQGQGSDAEVLSLPSTTANVRTSAAGGERTRGLFYSDDEDSEEEEVLRGRGAGSSAGASRSSSSIRGNQTWKQEQKEDEGDAAMDFGFLNSRTHTDWRQVPGGGPTTSAAALDEKLGGGSGEGSARSSRWQEEDAPFSAEAFEGHQRGSPLQTHHRDTPGAYGVRSSLGAPNDHAAGSPSRFLQSPATVPASAPAEAGAAYAESSMLFGMADLGYGGVDDCGTSFDMREHSSKASGWQALRASSSPVGASASSPQSSPSLLFAGVNAVVARRPPGSDVDSASEWDEE